MAIDGFWEHYCCVQRDIMGFEKGVPCDWCDEEDPNPFSIKVIVRNDPGGKHEKQ